MKRLINKLGIIAFSFNLFLDINATDIQTVEANAQYGPKVWSMFFQAENEERGQEMDIIIEGDSMFNGRKYLLAIINVGSNDPTERDTLLYRQEGGKVFFVPKGQEQEILLLDYDLQADDVFTNHRGTTFRVERVGFFDDCPCNIIADDLIQPKMLELKSIDGSQTDIWMEGIGSTSWGIFPFLPKKSQVFFSSGKKMEVFFSIDEPNYKKQYGHPHDFDSNEDFYAFMLGEYDNRTICSFVGDTLRVKGCRIMSGGTIPAVSCAIDSQNISIGVVNSNPYSFSFASDDRIFFNVKFPGFATGIYNFGDETLECKGPADGMNVVKPGAAGTDKRTYDLSGRPVSGKPQRGLYIQGGRKVVHTRTQFNGRD
ncbi:MAG: hypothetical protein J5671_04185 [Bacteroidaceae bacterium]|nr:hypothetical protein [Bacteroidaceae bacterium]